MIQRELQFEVWTLIIQKSTLIHPSSMVFYQQSEKCAAFLLFCISLIVYAIIFSFSSNAMGFLKTEMQAARFPEDGNTDGSNKGYSKS